MGRFLTVLLPGLLLLTCSACDLISPDESEYPDGIYLLDTDTVNDPIITTDISGRQFTSLLTGSSLVLEDGIYSIEIFTNISIRLNPSSGYSTYVSDYNGPFFLQDPLLLFDEEEPFFGVLNNGSVTLFPRYEDPRFDFYDWTFHRSNATTKAGFRLPDYDSNWASGEYPLVQAGRCGLPTWARTSSASIDTLTGGTLILNEGSYLLKLDIDVYDWDEVYRGSFVDTLAGQFHQSGRLMIFDAVRTYPDFVEERWPFFGVLRDTALVLYRVPGRNNAPYTGSNTILDESMLLFNRSGHRR